MHHATTERLGAVRLSSPGSRALGKPRHRRAIVIACQLAASDQVDDLVNRRQTPGVIELSEQTVIDQLVVRLTSRYPTIADSIVSSVVRDVYSRYDGRPLRDYVPLFVERHAKSELERLSATLR